MIPKTVHQIWLGGLENRPPRIGESMSQIETVFRSLGYDYRLWTEADLQALDIATFADIRPYAALSDLMRYQILAIHGGWYLDADCVPASESPVLPNDVDIFVIDSHQRQKYFNTILGAAPGHVLLQEYFRQSTRVFRKVLAGYRPKRDVASLVGPGLLFRLCRKHGIRPRRWIRWMAHYDPAAPIIHRKLHSWNGQPLHLANKEEKEQ